MKPLGRWWVEVPSEQWPSGEAFNNLLKQHWDPVWGDRRNELVFIGIGMDEAALRRELDACLVDEDAFRPDEWARLSDPFPTWGQS